MDHFTEFQSIIAAVYKEDQLPLSHFVDDIALPSKERVLHITCQYINELIISGCLK